MLLQRVPLGVVGTIVPWNWPYTMAAELFAPALAAGNTVVWLAAPTTAACSAALASVLTGADVGLPAGVLSFLNGPGAVAGDALAGHPGLDAIAFIGSVATGRSVAARAAGKTQILELGGNGPLVVLDDADLDLAVTATLEAAYLCAGRAAPPARGSWCTAPSGGSTSSAWRRPSWTGCSSEIPSTRRPRWGR